MPAEEKKTSLLVDLSDHLLVLLVGVISLTTFVPIFLNSVTEVLGWENIRWGYYLFVFIYFILPYGIYYLNNLSKSLLPYEKLFPVKDNLEVAIMLVGFLFLICPLEWADPIISIWLIAGGTEYAIRTCRDFRQGAPFKTESKVVFAVLIISTLFVLGPGYKAAWKFNLGKQTTAFETYKIKDVLDKSLVSMMDSARKESWKYRIAAFAIDPRQIITRDSINYCDKCEITSILHALQTIDNEKKLSLLSLKKDCKILKNSIDIVLKFDNTIVSKQGPNFNIQSDEIDASFTNLFDYAKYIQGKKMRIIASQWSDLIKDLQFKSICWIFLLLVIGTSRWYIMNKKLLERNDIGVRSKANLDARQKNLDQLKSFLLLMLILIAPWFRPVDPTTVDLARPFINFSLNNLIHGDSHAPGYNPTSSPKPGSDTGKNKNIFITNPAHVTDTVKIIDTIKVIDTNKLSNWQLNYLKWYSQQVGNSNLAPFNHDPMLDTIKKNVLLNQKLIKRTIGNPADRN